MSYFHLENQISKQLKDINESLKVNQLSDSLLKQYSKVFDKIDQQLKDQIHIVFEEFSHQTLILIPETAIQLNIKLEMADFYLENYLYYIKSESHFYIKALCLSAKLQSIYARDINKNIEEKKALILISLNHIEKAIEIVSKPKNNEKYSFMIYNISKIIFEIMRDYFRNSFLQVFTFLVEKVYKLLESNVKDEYDWKGQFSWILFNCLMDSEDIKKAGETLKELWTRSKEKPYPFHEILFRQRILLWDKIPGLKSEIEKEVNQMGQKWKNIYQLQAMKCGIIPENAVEKEINSMLRALNSEQTTIESEQELKSEYHELYAEISRVTVHYGIQSICDQLMIAMKMVSSKNYKAKFIMEMVKAEMLILQSKNQTKEDSQNKNGKKISQSQQVEREIANRKEALNIIQNALKLHKYFKDPWLIYEGSILLWNLSLPFLNDSFKYLTYKGFEIAANLLELTFCNDYQQRIRMLYELAQMDSEQGKVVEGMKKAKRALELSNYTKDKFYHGRINEIINDLNLQSGNFKVQFLETISVVSKRIEEYYQKNYVPRQSNIRELFQQLKEIREPVTQVTSNQDLDDSVKDNSTQNQDIQTQREMEYIKRKKYLVAFKLSELAFENKLFEVCIKICDYIVEKDWINEQKNQELIIKQALANYTLAECNIEILTKSGFYFEFKNPDPIKKEGFSLKLKAEDIEAFKNRIIDFFSRGVCLSQEIKQKWLIFNGSIRLWNRYLPAFKNPSNNSKLHPRITELLETYVQILKGVIQEESSKKISDYELDRKIQVYSNISIVYCRILENTGEIEKVLSLCDELLLCSLSLQTRKLVNSIRARMQTIQFNGNNKNQQKVGKQKDMLQNKNDQHLYEIIFQIEVVQNNNNSQEIQASLKDAYSNMKKWIAESDTEVDAEIACELWTKIANLALNEEQQEMTLLALKSLEQALVGNSTECEENFSKNFMRWLSFAEYLYVKAICRVMDKSELDFETQDFLLFKCLQYLINGSEKAVQCNNKRIFLDIQKKVFKIVEYISKNFKTNENLIILSKPLFSSFFYMKQGKQQFEQLMKDMDLSKMLVNEVNIFAECCQKTKDWELMEKACNIVLDLIDIDYRPNIWYQKIRALSNQNKSLKDIMNLIRECNSQLQAKLLVQMAYCTKNPQKQFQALSKAVNILKREGSADIVEILIDFCEWLQRNNQDKVYIVQNFNVAIDTVISQKMAINNDKEEDDFQKSKNGFFTPFSFKKRNRIFDMKFTKDKTDLFDLEKYQIDYSVADLEKLIRIHCMLSQIAPSKKESLLYVQDSFMFLMFIFILNHRKLKNYESKENQADIGSFPQTIDKLFQYKLTQEQLAFFQSETDPQVINKQCFLKPNAFIFYVKYMIEFFEECGFMYESLVCNKFLEVVTDILQHNSFQQFLVLKYAFFAKVFKKQELLKEKLTLFDQIKTDQLGFKKIKDYIFMNNLKDQKFVVSGIKDNIKAPMIINNYDEWEHWIDISKLLQKSGQHQLSMIYITEYLEIVEYYEAKELKGAAYIQIASILSFLGEKEKSFYYLKNSQKYFKEMKNWKNLIFGVSEHFDRYKEYDNSKNFLDSFYKILNSQDKSNIQECKKKELQSIIKLLLTNVDICQFENFFQNYLIESSQLYFENFRRVYQQIMVQLNEYQKLSTNDMSFKSIQQMGIVIQKLYQVQKLTKYLSPKILKYHYLVIHTLLQILNQIKQATNSFINTPLINLFGSSKLSKQSCLVQKELSRFQFYEASLLNCLFELKDYHFKLNLNLPVIEQKSFESFIFESKDFGDDSSMSQDQDDTKILVQKYFMTEGENEKVNKIVAKNILTLKELHFQKLQNVQDKEIELEILISEYKQSGLKSFIEKTDMGMVKDLLKGLTNKQSEIENLKNQTKKKQLLLKANLLKKLSSLLYMEFTDFFNQNYFSYNINAIGFMLQKKQEIHEDLSPADIIDYQSFKSQESLYNFLMGNSHQQNPLKREILKLMESRSESKFDELIKKQPIYSLLFKCNNFESNQELLYQNSIYLSLQLDSHSLQFYMVLFYVDQEGIITQKLIQQGENRQYMKEYKYFYKKSRALRNILAENEEEEERKEDLELMKTVGFYGLIKHKNKLSSLTKLMGNVKKFIQEVKKKKQEAAQQEEQQKEKKSKKPQKETLEQEKEFNKLVFLIDNSLIDFPFEYFIKDTINEQFSSFCKDISFHNLVTKQRKLENIQISKEEMLFINIENQKVKELKEIKDPKDQISSIECELLLKNEESLFGQGEWNEIMKTSKNVIFSGNFDFFGYYKLESFLGNLNKVDLQTFFCFDRMKIFDPEFFKYTRRRQLEPNKVRTRSFVLSMSLAGCVFYVVPRYYFTSLESQNYTKALQGMIENSETLAQNLKIFEQCDLNSIGISDFSFGSDGKKAKKKK